MTRFGDLQITYLYTLNYPPIYIITMTIIHVKCVNLLLEMYTLIISPIFKSHLGVALLGFSNSIATLELTLKVLFHQRVILWCSALFTQ